MRNPNMTSLSFATPLAFNSPDGEVLRADDVRKSLQEVKGWLSYKMAKKYC